MIYLTRFAVAAAALGLATTAASARPAVSQTDLNVRAGPGTAYEVVGVLREGQTVDVGACRGSWCQVNGSGWASANYLSFGGGGVAYAAPPAVVYDEPYDDYAYYGDYYYATPGVSFGFYAPGYRRGWRGGSHWSGGRTGWRGGNPGPGRVVGGAPSGGRVFGGRSFGGGGNVGMRSGGGFRGGAGGGSFRGGGGGGFRGGAPSGGGSRRH